MQERMIIVSVGLLLDLLFGDPSFLWHPVRGIGKCIEITEKLLRKIFHIREGRDEDVAKKRFAGVLLVVLVLSVSVLVPALCLFLAGNIHPYVRTGLACLMCYQILAVHSLDRESKKVYRALQKKDVGEARRAVSMIVGRDTDVLNEEGITKAAVETVAENTSDGVTAPLIYLFLFGPLGGFFYKAVNTMDSMVGYKNDTYRYFGTAAAKLDDILNFVPARISAILMIFAAFLTGMSAKDAYRIWRRDRRNHASPNSAQTEAVCAGALGVKLAGDAFYFGEKYEKKTIGDETRKIVPEDIRRADKLLYGTTFLTYGIGMFVCFLIGI